MTEVTTAAIVTDGDGDDCRILLTRRAVPPYKGKWCLPGGHIERTETAANAILREVKEETGLDFAPRFFRYFDEIIPDKGIHAVVLVFVGSCTGELVPSSCEVSETRWMSLGESRSLLLAFLHREMIEAYAQEIGATLSAQQGAASDHATAARRRGR
jgi:8-oxo-dGTP diphosphatase